MIRHLIIAIDYSTGAAYRDRKGYKQAECMIISHLYDVKGSMFDSTVEVHRIGRQEDIPHIEQIEEYILNHTIIKPQQ